MDLMRDILFWYLNGDVQNYERPNNQFAMFVFSAQSNSDSMGRRTPLVLHQAFVKEAVSPFWSATFYPVLAGCIFLPLPMVLKGAFLK